MNSKIPLVEIAEINPAKGHLSLDESAEVSFIPMQDVTDNAQWIGNQTRQLKEVNKGYTYFEEGDILFAKITPCMENGKGCLAVGLKNGVGFGSTEFHVLRAKPNGDAGFIFQWSIDQGLRRKAANRMVGSAGQQRVPTGFLETFLIPDLPRKNQTQIAEVLSTIDLSITHTENLVAKYQHIKTGLMQDLLTRGIDEHGQLRDPKTHKFKSSPFGLIPEDWKLVKLGDIIAESQGIIQTGPFGSQLHAFEYTSEGIPVIMPQDIGDDGKLLIEQAAKNSQSRANDLKRHILKANDVIFARRGDLSRCASIKPEQHGLCGSGCMLLRVSEDILSGDWMSIIYRYTLCQRQIAAQAVGSTMVNLNTQILANLLLPKPSIQEQRLVSRSILEFHAFLETKEFLLRKLMNLKNGLMQDLLTGEVSVEPLLTN